MTTKNTSFKKRIIALVPLIPILTFFFLLNDDFRESSIEFVKAFPMLQYKFSMVHTVALIGSTFILYLFFDLGSKTKKHIFFRVWYSLIDEDNLMIKLLLLLVISFSVLSVIVLIFNFHELPELYIAVFIYVILRFLKHSEKLDSDTKNNGTYIFTDEPIEKFDQLNFYQKKEVEIIKKLITAVGNEPLSIALNGSWGSGKSSILKGLKEKLEENKYEVIEVNLWKAKKPENAIADLEQSFKEVFGKVYLNISSQNISFFTALAGNIHSSLSYFVKLFGGDHSIENSEKKIEVKIKRFLKTRKQEKIVILIDDLDRTKGEYLNDFFKLIRYATKFKNVVVVAGINKSQIDLSFSRNEKININANGESFNQKYARHKINEDNFDSTPVTQRESIIKQEAPEKFLHEFKKIEHETFSAKIFTVQRDIFVPSESIRKYFDKNKFLIENFKKELHFEDKNNIINSILDFINNNYSLLKTYRNFKLFLNEVFVYLLGFGGNNEGVKVSDYVEIKSILAISWVKVLYPNFYEGIMNYVIPFSTREQKIKTDNGWRSQYNFKGFLDQNLSYDNNGDHFVVHTIPHKEINIIFSSLDKNTGFENPDAAIRYFHPVVEDYEYTTIEFSDFFNKKLIFNEVQKFIADKWIASNKKKVFRNITDRIKQRPFKLSERLFVALAFAEKSLTKDSSSATSINEKDIESVTVDYWSQLLSVFDNGFIDLDRNLKSRTIIDNVGIYDSEMFQLWEKMYNAINERYSLFLSENVRKHNLSYLFFNLADTKDNAEELCQGYSIVFDKLNIFKFGTEENRIRCLIEMYKQILITDHANFIPSEVTKLFLENLFKILKKIIPYNLLVNCDLIKDSIINKHDKILFEQKNIKKLISIFEKSDPDQIIDDFINNQIKNRITKKEFCELSNEGNMAAYKLLETFIGESYPDIGYEQTLKTFFLIKDEPVITKA